MTSVKKFLPYILGGVLALSALFFYSLVRHPQYADSPLQHSVYIWQRLWTPALIDSLKQTRSHFSGLRVLAAEFSTDGKLSVAQPDLAALAAANLPVYAVVRIDGRGNQQLNQTTQIAIVKILKRWQVQLPHLKGLEIDYDCPSSQLKSYADFLQKLRATIPPEFALSNTALPDWINFPELPLLLAQSDESVLQLHAVLSPTQGLFDTKAALAWVHAYQKLTDKPFQVALPAYSSQAVFNAEGKILAIESEERSAFNFDHGLELEADPSVIAKFLVELAKIGHQSVIWFRLPTSKDKRAWPLRTLQAVLAGESLAAEFEVTLEPGDKKIPGLVHLEILNKGNIAAALPRQLQVNDPNCTAADGVGTYSALPVKTGWLFSADRSEKLLPQQRRLIGWVRCSPGLSKDEINIVFKK